MRQLDLKKLLLPNLPYLLIGLYATKLGEAWRLAPGVDASAKATGPDGWICRRLSVGAPQLSPG